jgi:hypothetical protein
MITKFRCWDDAAERARPGWEKRVGCRVRTFVPSWLLPRPRPEAFDHVFTVRTDDGHKGLLLMPYEFGAERHTELDEWCKVNGYRHEVWGGGWWHPNTVSVLLFRNKTS